MLPHLSLSMGATLQGSPKLPSTQYCNSGGSSCLATREEDSESRFKIGLAGTATASWQTASMMEIADKESFMLQKGELFVYYMLESYFIPRKVPKMVRLDLGGTR